MKTPEFSLSLDEFPGLLDAPAPLEAVLGQPVLNALREGLASYPPGVGGHILLPWFNEMRHHFLVMGDEGSSMAFADLSLAYSSWDRPDGYTLSVLSEWASEPEVAVRALLDKAQRFKNLPSLYAACLKRASELCKEAGLQNEAQQLFLAWQDSSAPYYPELHPIVGQINAPNSATTLPDAPLQIQIPEPVEGAHNGWRDGRWIPVSPSQERDLRALIEKHDLHQIEERIVSLSQNAIGLESFGRQPYRVGASRLGGLPDVPAGWVWPENMEFLAQFNLEEIAPFDVNHVLPSKGMLRFFAQSVSYDITINRVEWDESDMSHLRLASYPDGYEDVELDRPGCYDQCVYAPIFIAPLSLISPPDSHYVGADDVENDDPNFIYDRVHNLHRELAPDRFQGRGKHHQLLGRFDDGQEDVEEWQLLFQIDSDGEAGVSFSDAGTVFFFIHRDDLLARNFDRVRVGMICG